jgi:hypothetical protein
MDSNTHSTRYPTRPPDELTALATAVEDLAAQDLHGLTDAVRAERVLRLRRLLTASKATGSTAGWLRTRLRMGPAPPPAVSAPPEPCSVAP